LVINPRQRWRKAGEINMIKRIGGAIGVLLVATAAVVGAKTMLFAPEDIADSQGIVLAPIPKFDVGVAADHLGQAIRFQTVSHQDPAENKPEEWQKLQAWMQTTYPAAHKAMVREIVDGGTLIYRWSGSDSNAKPIILMAHQDVVPITPGTEKDWKHAPFDGLIANGAVWGRGAVDDKGSLIGLMEALELLAKQGFKPKRSVYIVSGHNEEVGGGGAKAAAAHLAAQGVKALFTIDEGSAIITDAPVIKAPAILIGIAEKGYATLRLTANATGGHSSMPPTEIGTVNLAKAVVAIHDNQFPSQLRAPVSAMVAALAARKGGLIQMAVANQWLFSGLIRKQFAATPAGAAMLHTTIAPTMLQGSPKENVLPQAATALINYRIAPGDTSADVMAMAKNAIGSLPIALSWVKEPREPANISSAKSQGWKFIRAAAEPEAPGAVVTPFLVVAGTDSRSFSGVSDDVYRFAPNYFGTKDTGMIHGTNEHITLDNLTRQIRFFARLIATAAG
jgi:carboxypeptidase PM20D1